MNRNEEIFWEGFKKELVEPVNFLIKNNFDMAAAKLILTGIDSLAGFYKGERENNYSVSKRFIEFVQEYMSNFDKINFIGTGLKNAKNDKKFDKPSEILYYIFRNGLLHEGELGIGARIYRNNNRKILWSGEGIDIFEINILGFFEYYKKAISDYEKALFSSDTLKKNFSRRYEMLSSLLFKLSMAKSFSKIEINRTNNKKNMNFLWIDEKENAIDSLERCLEFLQRTKENTFFWKWVAISLHNALYGFMIWALEHGNPDHVLKSTKKRPKLIDFNKALSHIQDGNYIRGYNVKPVKLTKTQKKNILFLKDVLRNNFEHFIPKGWHINLNKQIKNIIEDATYVIQELVSRSPSVGWFEEKQMKRIKYFLKSIIKELKHNLL